MKFTLKDYQEQAVDDVLSNLKRARENFKNPDKRNLIVFADGHHWSGKDGHGRGRNRGAVLG